MLDRGDIRSHQNPAITIELDSRPGFAHVRFLKLRIFVGAFAFFFALLCNILIELYQMAVILSGAG